MEGLKDYKGREQAYVKHRLLEAYLKITQAVYTSKNTTLTVDAQSDYNAAANLEVVGFDFMTFRNGKWEFEDPNVAPGSVPNEVTVSGPEGSETLAVTIK